MDDGDPDLLKMIASWDKEEYPIAEHALHTHSDTLERLENILTYSSNKPPEGLTRRNDCGKIEMFRIIPAKYHPPTGLVQKFHTIDSYGFVVNFVAGEHATPEQVPPDWAKRDAPDGGGK